MPFAAPASDSTGDFEQLISLAGFGQVMYPPSALPIPLPQNIAASTGTWSSGTMLNDGYRFLTVGVTMTSAGSLVISPFIDVLATMPRPAITTAIVANTLLIVDLPVAAVAATPGPFYPPFASFTITINNTGALATITNFQVILSGG